MKKVNGLGLEMMDLDGVKYKIMSRTMETVRSDFANANTYFRPFYVEMDEKDWKNSYFYSSENEHYLYLYTFLLYTCYTMRTMGYPKFIKVGEAKALGINSTKYYIASNIYDRKQDFDFKDFRFAIAIYDWAVEKYGQPKAYEGSAAGIAHILKHDVVTNSTQGLASFIFQAYMLEFPNASLTMNAKVELFNCGVVPYHNSYAFKTHLGLMQLKGQPELDPKTSYVIQAKPVEFDGDLLIAEGRIVGKRVQI